MALKKSPHVEIRKSNGFPYFHSTGGVETSTTILNLFILILIPFGIKSGIST